MKKVSNVLLLAFFSSEYFKERVKFIRKKISLLLCTHKSVKQILIMIFIKQIHCSQTSTLWSHIQSNHYI